MAVFIRGVARGIPVLVLGFALAALIAHPGHIESRGAFEIPKEYTFLYDWGVGLDDTESLRRRLPVKRIVLERTPCFGDCPAYRLTLANDGSAIYEGRMFVEREGVFLGELSLEAFAMLAFATERIGFGSLRASYSAEVTDMPTTIVTVVHSTGLEVRVSDYAYQAPPEFWLLTEALDAAARRIDWRAEHPQIDRSLH